MEDNNYEGRKEVTLVFPCPNCSETASPSYTGRELEIALEAGELPVYHITCDHSWKHKLSSQETVHLKTALDKGLFFP